ncbi:MAG TPA: hypothetical protein DCF68_07940 [Cyanothece sp. UBA12306]|nr:hypothetical protein [Cyanothece sp. UBA12306]
MIYLIVVSLLLVLITLYVWSNVKVNNVEDSLANLLELYQQNTDFETDDGVSGIYYLNDVPGQAEIFQYLILNKKIYYDQGIAALTLSKWYGWWLLYYWTFNNSFLTCEKSDQLNVWKLFNSNVDLETPEYIKKETDGSYGRYNNLENPKIYTPIRMYDACGNALEGLEEVYNQLKLRKISKLYTIKKSK